MKNKDPESLPGQLDAQDIGPLGVVILLICFFLLLPDLAWSWLRRKLRL